MPAENQLPRTALQRMFRYDGEIPEELAEDVGLPFDFQLAASLNFTEDELALNYSGRLSERQYKRVRAKIMLYAALRLLLMLLVTTLTVHIFVSTITSLPILTTLAGLWLAYGWFLMLQEIRMKWQVLHEPRVSHLHGQFIINSGRSKIRGESGIEIDVSKRHRKAFTLGMVYDLYYVAGNTIIISAAPAQTLAKTKKASREQISEDAKLSFFCSATYQDLQANRVGLLSDGQKQYFARNAAIQMLFFASVLVSLVFFVLVIERQGSFGNSASILAFVIIIPMWLSFMRFLSARAGYVNQFKCDLSKIQRIGQFIFLKKDNFILLKLPKKATAHLLKASGGTVTFYYLPFKQTIINAEITT